MVMYLRGQVSLDKLRELDHNMNCRLMQIDEPLRPPSVHEPERQQYSDQYTKLLLWNMTDYERLVYLDADTLVVGDVSALLELPREIGFAAVGDVWHHGASVNSFLSRFNAGVLSLVPC